MAIDQSVLKIDPVLEHDGWIEGIDPSVITTVSGQTSIGAGDVGRFIVRRALVAECPEGYDNCY